MIIKFLIEKRSWILLFMFLQIFNLFVASIDSRIAFQSMVYIVFISFLSFVVFLFFRYQKETIFYKSLEDREDNLDLSNLPAATSPLEKIIEESIIKQTEMLQQEATSNSIALQQEKDDLLSWIHEVKTPLTAMHLLIDRVEEESIRYPLTFEWLRIHLLLDQQLHQKRILFMHNDLYMENTNLEELIYGEIKTIQSWCMQKGIGFEINLDVKEVICDVKWLAFIIRQLLTNAVKYSNESDIEISSFLKNQLVVLRIEDSGIGIVAKDLPRIFEKGFTSTTNSKNYQATGMGLYLTKKAADTLHIHIEVASQQGKGTTITLTFPKRNDFTQIHSTNSGA